MKKFKIIENSMYVKGRIIKDESGKIYVVAFKGGDNIQESDNIINVITFEIYRNIVGSGREFAAMHPETWVTLIAEEEQLSRKFVKKYRELESTANEIKTVYVKVKCLFINQKAAQRVGDVNLNWIIDMETTIPGNYYLKALNGSTWIEHSYGNGLILGTDFLLVPQLKPNGEVSLKSIDVKNMSLSFDEFRKILSNFADKVDDQYRMYTRDNTIAWDMVDKFITEEL